MNLEEQTKSPALIERIWYMIRSVLGLATMLVLMAMTGLTVVDVVARYLFNSPVNGAFELTEMMLATVIFLAMPLTTAKGEHIEVQLLNPVKMGLIDKIMTYLPLTISAVVFAFIARQVWLHAVKLAGDGAVTNSLSLPLSSIGYLAAASCALSAVIIVLKPFFRL
jgi:TRAP-type C4-dicarboxylate transport system permease small subunit